METLPKDDIFVTPVKLLKFLGEAKHYISVNLLVFRIFNISVLLLIAFYICVNFLHAESKMRIRTLQALVTVSQLLLKYTLFIYYKSDIESISRDAINNFKIYEKNPVKVNKEFGKIFKMIQYIQATVIFTLVVTVYLYMLRPLLHSSFIFALETFIPNSYALDAFLLMSQFYFLCVALPIVLTYDLIYLTLCVHVILQVRILKREIARLPTNYDHDAKNQIKISIDYHHTLLSIRNRMKVVYSAMLLFHYLVTVFTACIDLFLVIGVEDVTTMMIESLSISFVFGQFACYTFPAEELTTEFADISNAVYLSKSVVVQKLLLHVMTNSQKVQYFSGFGLIDINVDAFGSVVRRSFSFYTIIRNLVNK